MKKRVIIAMSGGVDSSVAAYLLLKQGYDVIGLTMKLPISNSSKEESACCGMKGIFDARAIASKLNIPFYVVDCEKEFEKNVINYFCDEYRNGRTPNPCVICNETMKFGYLFKKAKELGAEFIATGHYAKIEFDKSINRHLLKKGIDLKKDQSYFLCLLSQDKLKNIILPLGDYTKEKVRNIAKEQELKVYDKPGSQEICFIPENEYRDFIKNYLTKNDIREGNIIDSSGKIVGKHKGIPFYTIGQRKGIGAHRKKMYVVSINKNENTVVIGDDKELYKKEFFGKNINWISIKNLEKPMKVKARIRYRHIEKSATVYPLDENKVKVIFDEPERAITSGQAVVFYDNDIVIGGGWIV